MYIGFRVFRVVQAWVGVIYLCMTVQLLVDRVWSLGFRGFMFRTEGPKMYRIPGQPWQS